VHFFDFWYGLQRCPIVRLDVKIGINYFEKIMKITFFYSLNAIYSETLATLPPPLFAW